MRAPHHNGAAAPGLAAPELARVDHVGLAALGAAGTPAAGLIADAHKDETPGRAGTEGFKDQRKADRPDCAAGTPNGKPFATRQALLALRADDAKAIAREVDTKLVTMPVGCPKNADVNDLAQRDGFDALEVLPSIASKRAEPEPAPMPFDVVEFGDLATVEPPPPSFVWEGLIPAGHVTLLAAHGGVGKSMVALMLCVAVALGLPLFGIPTRRGVVAFFSGEDGAALLRYRLRLICRHLGVRVSELAGRLFILDATDGDPTLFAEAMTDGRREGVTTATYDGLSKYVAAKGVSLLVVDNASDAFDASEIDRARVRGFMRALARIARECNAGVLLLAHVDKGTSRGDRGKNSEGYSGSTAWNNSARSRLFMSCDKDGARLLEHQKHNLGMPHDTVRLIWPEGGIPQAAAPVNGFVQGISEHNMAKALLRLIDEFTKRGEFVTAATTSRTHAAKLLRNEPTYPKLMKDGAVFDLLRKAEREGHLERFEIKGKNRHPREVWNVTAAGAAFAGIPAPTALTAPTSVIDAPEAAGAEACADCADFSARGCGGNAGAQEVSAEATPGVDRA